MTDTRLTLAFRRRLFLAAALLQAFCGLMFLIDLAPEVAHLRADGIRELLGVIALTIGTAITFREYQALLQRNTKVERQLDVASGDFQTALAANFADWGLTEAERDVALLSIKGLSIAEIAAARGSRDGTIKAQLTAIYRKAGVSSRAELISLLIEDLISGIAVGDATNRT